MTDLGELVDVQLTDEERRTLKLGLASWGGPAHCTNELAVAMGFVDVPDLLAQGDRIEGELADRRPLSRWDWSRRFPDSRLTSRFRDPCCSPLVHEQEKCQPTSAGASAASSTNPSRSTPLADVPGGPTGSFTGPAACGLTADEHPAAAQRWPDLMITVPWS